MLIARAIAQNAALLIMDEPTSSLDFGNQIRVLEKIEALRSQNRSLILTTHLVSDLDEAIDKLTAKAKKRVYLTAITRPHFLDREIFHAIERDDLGFPTYIYLLNRLYQGGIEAELHFLPSPTSAFQGEYQDFENAVEFSLGKLNDAEKTKLFGFYQRKQQQNQPIQQGQDKWALISWRCEG